LEVKVGVIIVELSGNFQLLTLVGTFCVGDLGLEDFLRSQLLDFDFLLMLDSLFQEAKLAAFNDSGGGVPEASW
jgi:hypothetical protein